VPQAGAAPTPDDNRGRFAARSERLHAHTRSRAALLAARKQSS